MEALLPNFIILGAQKSASTFIHECLIEHPDVYMPHEETAFFEDHLYDSEDLSWLYERFKNNEHIKVKGIKRPNYLALPQCADRIKHHLPDAQFIIVLRNPVERLISAYFHYIWSGFLPNIPFEEGMERLFDGSLEKEYPRARDLIEYGKYDKHLRYYFDRFERDQFLILFHEDILNDKLKAVQQTFAFLGVDPTFVPQKAMQMRPKKAVYNLRRSAFIGAFRRFGFYQLEGGTRIRRKPFSKAPIGNLTYGAGMALDRFLLAKLFPNNKPKVDSILLNWLNAEYRNSIHGLSKFIDQLPESWQK